MTREGTEDLMDIISGGKKIECMFKLLFSLLLSMPSLHPYPFSPNIYFLLDRRYFTNWTASLAALSQPGWVLGQFMYAPPGSEQQAG